MSEKKLLGVMVVGPKRSHAPYYHEDVRLLQVLTSQATVAFKNSVLYERVLFANRYIENIVATVQSGILVVDGKENVRLLNHAATNLLGLATQEVPTSLPLQTLPEAIVTVLNETLATDAPSRTVEVRITRNSIEACLMCCATPLKGMDGGVAGVVASLSDLSTLKQLEIERARAERLNYFENLAAALAHEIANPIVPIKIMTQLLSTRSGESAFIADFVRTVGREVSRIETLVQRLNSLSSPASRRITHVDLRAVVSQVFDLVEAMFEEKQVRLHVRLEPHRLMVLGEENELQELFLNLVTNALEATPSGGSVEVQGTIDSDEIVVSVRDTGPGVPSQLASQIFEPFVSSKNRGSGLGLAICHGIVKRHQGEIQALNADIGAVFTVRLPTSAKDLPPGSPDLRQIQGSRPNKPA